MLVTTNEKDIIQPFGSTFLYIIIISSATLKKDVLDTYLFEQQSQLQYNLLH